MAAGEKAFGQLPEDPGDPPPFNWNEAELQEYQYGGREVACDSNWCVVLEMTPEEDYGLAEHYCLNSAGPLCVLSPNGEEAAQWLSDYISYKVYTDPVTYQLCVLFDEECPIAFPGDRVLGCPPDDAACIENRDNPPEPTPPPPSAHCPPDSVMQADVRVTSQLLDPPHPVVIGQDTRLKPRGADLEWQVEVPPVIHTWYEEQIVGTEAICYYEPNGRGDGCPGPGEQYAQVLGSNVGWQPFMAEGDTARFWQAEGEAPKIECVKHIDVYAERLAWLHLKANLKPESREWILEGSLQDHYPRAHLYQPDWLWFPSLQGGVLGDGTFYIDWTEPWIQFRDPGQYTTSAKGVTTGTLVTEPRYFDLIGGEFSVWVMTATLSR